MVVHAPEPSLQHHDHPVQFGEVAPLLAGGDLHKVPEVLFHGAIPGPLVGGDLGLKVDVVFHETPEGCRIGMFYHPCIEPRHTLFLLFDTDHHQSLVLVLTAPDALFLTAEDRLVDLGLTAYGEVAGALHRLHYLALEAPACLLPQAQFAGKLGGGDALLVGRDEVHDVERLERVELHLVEQGVGRGGLIVSAGGALPGMGRPAPAIIAMPAPVAFETFRPLQVGKVFYTAVTVGESLPELEK